MDKVVELDKEKCKTEIAFHDFVPSFWHLFLFKDIVDLDVASLAPKVQDGMGLDKDDEHYHHYSVTATYASEY